MCLFNLLECFVDALYGEAHDIVVTAVKTCDADVAYPFLDAVGASLVEGLIVGDVIVDLVIGEGFEGDIGSDGKAAFRLTAEHTDTGSDLMGTSADEPQHPCGICLIGGFTKNLVAHDDHSIGCNHEFVVGKGGTIGIGFLTSNVKGHLRHRQIVRITLVDILQHPNRNQSIIQSLSLSL